MTSNEPYEPYLARHLQPGERLRVACRSKLPQGNVSILSKAQGSYRHVEGALDSVAPTNVFDGLVFGKAAAGARDSAAMRLYLAQTTDAPYGGLLAVTDRRLLWCGLTAPPLGHWSYRGAGGRAVPDDLVRVVAELGRAEVASARVGRHRLSSGRLWLTFTDDSWVAFAGEKACHDAVAGVVNG